MSKRMGKVFSMFKSGFSIDLYHKPSMVDEDIYYYIILDNSVKIKATIKRDIFIITEISKLSPNAYLTNFYKKLIKFLQEQTFFTVLIDKTGSVYDITDVCLNMGIETVEDKRLITIPEIVYDKLVSIYNNDLTYYGFYLIQVVEPKIKEPDIIVGNNLSDRLNSYIISKDNNSSVSFTDNQHPDYNYILSYKNNLIKMYLYIENNNINIVSVESKPDCSRIYYIELLEYLEKFDKKVTFIFRNVNNKLLYEICGVRNYEKIKGNNFGSYIVKPISRVTVYKNGTVVEKVTNNKL